MPDPRKRPDRAADRARQLLSQDPPQAHNAERGLLSCVIQSRDCLAAAQDLIPSPEVFDKPAHIFVWEAMVKISGGGGDVHLSAVEAALSGRGVLQQAGGIDYLIDLMDRTEASPTVGMTQTLARAVIDMHAKRRVIALGQRMIIDGHETQDEASVLLERVQSEAMDAGESIQTSSATSGRSTMAELMDAEFEDGVEGRPMPTGYYDLDDMIDGLKPGHLVVIGARPSMGKSSLMTGLASGVTERGCPSLIFSLEMRRKELADRILSAKSRVNVKRFNELVDGGMEDTNLREARAEIARMDLVIDDTPGISLMQVRARVRREQAERGVRAVFIDYLQLMAAEKQHSREREVAVLSAGCKELAREFGVAVVLLCQLNRGAEGREGHRPRMSDLRESGSIEQDADEVMLVHRPDYYAAQKDRSHVPDGVAEVIIAKQRNGPTGIVRLQFDAECAAMRNRAQEEQESRQGDLVYN